MVGAGLPRIQTAMMSHFPRALTYSFRPLAFAWKTALATASAAHSNGSVWDATDRDRGERES